MSINQPNKANKKDSISTVKITIEGDVIKEVGEYVANIKLHREVVVSIKFEVVAE
ncbi:MAG TPA: 50S ribosomal L9 C-terminal domain-containing protein [Salinivirgaceae bacterium]|nr:50S ribosomal L9 C-terminal domain-containing protein [Salinivirgaceae bacterium]